MNEIFLVFLSLSISGAILTFVLLLSKPVLKSRLSKTWQYYVCLIVILRLLIPFTPDVSAVGGFFNSVEHRFAVQNTPLDIIPDNAHTDIIGQHEISDLPTAEMEWSSDFNSPVTTTAARYLGILVNNLWIIWIVTALVLIVRRIAVYHSFTQFMKAGCCEAENDDLHRIYQELCVSLKIRKPPVIYKNEIAAAPMLIGILRPFIVLPDIKIEKKEIRYVLLHELTHYKRLDIFYKWLVQIAVSLHWFNPFAYWINSEINRNCELSCDEAIIKRLDKKEKYSYGDTLIATIKPSDGYSNSIVSITLNENKKLIKERLEAIMKYKKKSRVNFFVSVLFSAILLCGATFTGAYAANLKDSQSNMQYDPQHEISQNDRITPYKNIEMIKTLENENIENIKIQATTCSLILELTSEDMFEACFSYPDFLAPNYEKYFDLIMERESTNTIVISTEFDDHGFDTVSELDSTDDYIDLITLKIKIPEKHYNNVNINLSVVGNDVFDFMLEASTLEITSRVNNITFKTNNIFDNLIIDHYVGEFNLELSELSNNMSVDVAIGTFTLMLPKNPLDINLLINNKDSEAYELPSAWKPLIAGNTVTYASGSRMNKITVNNNKLGEFMVRIDDVSTSAIDANTDSSIDAKEYYTDLSMTSFAMRKHSEINSDGNYFTLGRVDVVDNNGYDHQAIIIVCSGSDSFTREYHNYLDKLKTAYPNNYGYIIGYRNADNGPRTYREMDIEFFTIQNVTYVDYNGVTQSAVVIAVDGSEDFVEKEDELYSVFYDAYKKRK